MEEVDCDLQNYISQGIQEILDQPDLPSPPPREASPPISQVITYSVDIEGIPQSTEEGPGTIFVDIGSPEFAQF